MTATDIREEIIDILADIVPDEDLSNLRRRQAAARADRTG